MKTVPSIFRTEEEPSRGLLRHKICSSIFPKNARKVVVFNNFLDQERLDGMMLTYSIPIAKAAEGRAEEAIELEKEIGKRVDPPHLELVVEKADGRDGIHISKDGMGFEIYRKGEAKMILGFPEGYRYVDFERDLVACVVEVAGEAQESTFFSWPDWRDLSEEERGLLQKGLNEIGLSTFPGGNMDKEEEYVPSLTSLMRNQVAMLYNDIRAQEVYFSEEDDASLLGRVRKKIEHFFSTHSVDREVFMKELVMYAKNLPEEFHGRMSGIIQRL